MERAAEQPGRVNLVVAYAAEARPLVQHFGLTPAGTNGGFHLHASEWMQLVVCGVGKSAAAAATGYLFARGGSGRDQAWLNVGIGGHRDLPVGSVRLAHRVLDRATGQRWYPQPTFRLECGTCDVVTVDVPEETYPEDAIYEMEASAFYDTCVRFSSAELVHVIKCVSDNRSEPLRNVTPQRTERLLEDALAVIDAAVAAMSEAAATQRRLHADPPELAAFLERWHFTATQTLQLRDALRRWALIRPQPAMSAVESARAARQVLHALARELEAHPTELEPRHDGASS